MAEAKKPAPRKPKIDTVDTWNKHELQYGKGFDPDDVVEPTPAAPIVRTPAEDGSE